MLPFHASENIIGKKVLLITANASSRGLNGFRAQFSQIIVLLGIEKAVEPRVRWA